MVSGINGGIHTAYRHSLHTSSLLWHRDHRTRGLDAERRPIGEHRGVLAVGAPLGDADDDDDVRDLEGLEAGENNEAQGHHRWSPESGASFLWR